ncbi:MAG: hypothetical protein K9N05_05230 [Candidatus Marinimicrobia bacterium]|nr:hypothetical protein [Candidatus Neomarinimicrobiota bacterium]
MMKLAREGTLYSENQPSLLDPGTWVFFHYARGFKVLGFLGAEKYQLCECIINWKRNVKIKLTK